MAFRTVRGYERWDHHYLDRRTVYVHQLLVIAQGSDPHKVFSAGEYHVHHKNGIPWDNRPENTVLLTVGEHAAEHPERGSDKKYTDEEMLGWINTYVEEMGHVPTVRQIEGWPGPDEHTYRRRFGSFRNARRLAGWEDPGHKYDVNGNLVQYDEPRRIEEGSE